MTDSDLLANEFEANRPHLLAVAYRMLGSASEADDAVQEAWLRLQRTDSDEVANLGGWLTTVVGRVCLDMLRARRSRREDYVGAWAPDADDDESADPAREALLSDSVGLALLVVLDTLGPAERLAFVLHDLFDVSFEEVARIVGRTPTAARKLASRARRRVREGAPVADPDMRRQREVVDAFLAASRAGDFEALVAVLDPDVEFRADVRETISGATTVAEQVLARGTPFAPLARPALVGGRAGAVVVSHGRPVAVVAMTVVGGRVAAIDLAVSRKRVDRFEIDEELLG